VGTSIAWADHATNDPCGKLRLTLQTGPQISPLFLARGSRRSSLKVDRSLKGSPQSGIVDPCDVFFENSCTPRIIERDDHLADFAARAAKEARRRWPPLVPECVDFIGYGKRSRLVLRIAGDGKTQEEQKPFANSAGTPIPRPSCCI
jgi:hypothetical protein